MSCASAIVITGVGLVTPLGHTPTAVFANLARPGGPDLDSVILPGSGDPGVRATRVRDFHPEADLGDLKTLRLMNHDAQFAAVAARRAVQAARLRIGTDYRTDEVALFGATGLAGIELAEVAPLISHFADQGGEFDPRRFGRVALQRVRPTLSFKILSNMPVCFVSIIERIQGPNAVYNPWEAQGAQAIRAGMAAIATGRVGCALVGGSDVKAHELAYISLRQHGLLPASPAAGGLVPGEGAVFLVLEREDLARARQAPILARIAVAASTAVSLPRAGHHDVRDGRRSPSEPPEPIGVPSDAGGEWAVCRDRQRRQAFLRAHAPTDGVAPAWIIGGGNGVAATDRLEADLLAELFPSARVIHPKRAGGDLFAAAAALQVALAATCTGDGPLRQPALALCTGHGPAHDLFLLHPPDDRPAAAPHRSSATPATGPEISTAHLATHRDAPETITPIPTAHRDDPPLAAAAAARARPRVVVTGIGIIGPQGNAREPFWAAIRAGRSGLGPITGFDASGLTVRIGGEVKAFTGDDLLPHYPDVAGERDRKVWLGLAAAREALIHAGLVTTGGRGDPAEPGDSTNPAAARAMLQQASLHVGVSLEVFFLQDLTPHVGDELRPGALAIGLTRDGTAAAPLQTPLDRLAAMLADRHGFAGGRWTNCSACAAGSQVIGEALDLIRRGEVELALAGAADSMLNPLGLGGFSLLRALSTRNDDPRGACRPFDAARDGTVLGEGAAFLVLEHLEHARRRGATPIAEVLGYGASLDAYRVSDPDPDGRGAALSMRAALRDAALEPHQIDLVNAHGTGTPKNDIVETRAIETVLGDRARQIPVHAVKSMTGHLIAASGAVEAAVAALTIRDGWVPPTINLECPDPECPLDYVPLTGRAFTGATVLSNSFAFGGQNATLIFGQPPRGDPP